MKTSFTSSFGVFVTAILLKVFHVYNIFAVFPLTLGFSRFVIISSTKRDSISFLCTNSFAFRPFSLYNYISTNTSNDHSKHPLLVPIFSRKTFGVSLIIKKLLYLSFL